MKNNIPDGTIPYGTPSCTATIGFDGFVDEVLHVVETRQDVEHYQRVNYLADYGQKIVDAAGLSLNVEMVPVSRKLGGNGVIMANSLVELGVCMNYIGALGENRVLSEFGSFCQRANVVSLCDPGHTDAIEFLDGKIISSRLDCLKAVNWNRLKSLLPLPKMAAMLDESGLIGFENWSLLMNVESIWQGIMNEVLPLMQTDTRSKFLFFDLADPAKRTKTDLRRALALISQYQQYFQVVLGVNQREAVQLTRVLGCSPQTEDLTELALAIQNVLGISAAVVHSVRQAAASCADEQALVDGPYCLAPVITTGAGDHFNAGFMLGMLQRLPLKSALLLGCANSGYYVRNAKSPNLQQLLSFLEEWQDSEKFSASEKQMDR